MSPSKRVLLSLSAFSAVACGPASVEGPGDAGPTVVTAPATYTFESRFTAGASSVEYGEQVLRNVLIGELEELIDGLTARLDNGYVPAPGDVVKDLDAFWRIDAKATAMVPSISTTPPPKQRLFEAFPLTTNLEAALASPGTSHKDWSKEFKGWNGAASPEALVRWIFTTADSQAVARANAMPPVGPLGTPLTSAAITPDGVELHELVQKFLIGSVSFSEAADTFLDDDALASDNTKAVAGQPYTALEHAWDQGFGAFGAARDIGLYTEDEIAGAAGRPDWKLGYHDSDGDGKLDLFTEYNFPNAGYAAKRDRGSNVAAKTRFSKDTIEAFVRGRALITSAGGALTPAALDELKALRNQAIQNWEKALAASVVHYVNEVLAHMKSFGTEGYDFVAHTEHWSEMKAFALAFQFNPRSLLNEGQFVALHSKLGAKPVFPGQQGIEEYKASLRDAREILAAAFGFAAANLGDADGAGGW